MSRQRIEPGPGQESVWDYPRPPRVEPSDEEVVVRLGGQRVEQLAVDALGQERDEALAALCAGEELLAGGRQIARPDVDLVACLRDALLGLAGEPAGDENPCHARRMVLYSMVRRGVEQSGSSSGS